MTTDRSGNQATANANATTPANTNTAAAPNATPALRTRHAAHPTTPTVAKATTAPTLNLTLTSGPISGLIPALIAALATPLAPATAHAADGCVTVEVHHVRPQQGMLMAAAFADAEGFGKRPVAQVRVPAGDAVTRFALCGLTGDTVAISMFQDLDSDNAMGRSLVGLPTEPWGSSGSPGPFGPSWDTGKVAVDGKPIVVKLSQ